MTIRGYPMVFPPQSEINQDQPSDQLSVPNKKIKDYGNASKKQQNEQSKNVGPVAGEGTQSINTDK